MKKVVKTAGISIAVLLLLLLTAPVLLRGKIADIVKREANEMLTAKLDFRSLNISFLRHFPRASLELRGMTLVGVERFEGDTIAAVERLSVVVNPLSLFGDGGFEVTKVILAAPSVHAHKCADGVVNWDVVKPSDKPVSGEESSDGKDGTSSFRLSVRDFRLEKAVIRYEDDSSGMRFSVEPLALRLRGDMSAAHTDLDLRIQAERMNFLSGSIPLLSDAEASLDARIDADLEHGRFTFSENRLRLNAIELALDGWVEKRGEALAMDLKAGCEKVQFKDVLSLVPAFYTRDFRRLSASGELSMSVWAKGEMRGAVLPAFELKTEVRDGSFQYSSLPKAVTDIRIAASVSNPGGVMDRTVVDLSKFGFAMAGNTVSATFHATNLASDPEFRATAEGRIDLGAIGEVYPLEKGTELGGRITADVQVSGRMSDIEKQRYERIGARGSIVAEELGLTLPSIPEVHIRRAAASVSPTAMTLGECGVTVGRSDLSANGQLTGYIGYLLRGERLSGRLYVRSNLLDLNELLASSPTSDEAEQSASAASGAASVESQPLVIPTNLDLKLETELQQVLFAAMKLERVSGAVSLSDGVLSLDRLSMGVFGGRASASGRLATASDRASTLSLAANVSNASFSRTFEELELVRQLVPIFAKTGGDYSLSLDLDTPLDEQLSPDLGALNASGEIRSEHIELQQIEAFDRLATLLKDDRLRKIEARDVAIRFAIRDGRVATQPFGLKLTDNISVDLSGSTGLDQTIDYTACVKVPIAGREQTFDVGIGGTFSDPRLSLDVKKAAEEAVRSAVDEQVQKLTGSESLSEELSKRAEQLRSEAQRAGEQLVKAAEEQRTKLVEAAAEKGAIARLAAQKAGDKLVQEAEKQAANLVSEAEQQIEKLSSTGKTE
ncbi:AsmA-like C-terminal region-containing protein [Alistipes sp.]|uniref:AsmA family protein n=1 Tax=Alistipes sp. TaxID=1872444 RepID=UPI0025C33FF4|nr:AsmA-like C-terminal region-containing protein [Alistipes sp.]